MLIVSIVFPMALGGARLAIRAPHIIFWKTKTGERCLGILFSILTFLTSPLHSLILTLRKYYIELKLRADPESRDLLREWDEV